MKNADLYHLCLNAYHEARGESDSGIKAVTKVVLNRAANSGKGAHHEIYKKYQFEWTSKKQLNPLLEDPKEYRRIRVVTKEAIAEYNAGDTLHNADHYHGDYMRPFPYWAYKMKQVAHIGKHIFYNSKLGA